MSSKAKTEKAPGEKLEEKKTKKKGSSPEALFSSNKFMLALSFVAAFFIWVVMSVSNGETVNYPVTEIPVTMELSEEAWEGRKQRVRELSETADTRLVFPLVLMMAVVLMVVLAPSLITLK